MSDQVQPHTRIWEIDVVRGVAVIAMIFFHFMWDLQYTGLSRVNVFSTSWQIFARSIGTSFIFLLGLSLWLASTRMPGQDLWRYVVLRSIKLIALGLAITAGTVAFVGDAYVRFGILHLMGSMLIFCVPFLRAPIWVTLGIGMMLTGIGAYLTSLTVPFPWLIPLGLTQAGVTMVDYYPLLPWGGAALFGIAVGRLIYPNGQRRFVLPEYTHIPPIHALRFLGRHSLLIYLLHQPILLGILFALRAIR